RTVGGGVIDELAEGEREEAVAVAPLTLGNSVDAGHLAERGEDVGRRGARLGVGAVDGLGQRGRIPRRRVGPDRRRVVAGARLEGERQNAGHASCGWPARHHLEAMKIGTIVAIAIAVILVVWGVSSYNGLVSSEQTVEAQWAQVENVYQRRADLIPN